MLTQPDPDPFTFADAAVVTLRCAIEGCDRRQNAQGKHLDNLLAAGPWLCPNHKEDSTMDLILVLARLIARSRLRANPTRHLKLLLASDHLEISASILRRTK